MKKGIPLTNMKSADRVTDLYLSMRYKGMIIYVYWTWYGLDLTVLPYKEPLYLLKISSDALTLVNDIGQLIMSLLAT